jgi:hypothetical protein
MINRLKEFVSEPEGERPPVNEFYEVIAGIESFYVVREIAERLFAELASESPPRWVRFMDVHGSRICVKGRLIECVRESTDAQRAAERAFHRERRRERKADRTWDDDESWF